MAALTITAANVLAGVTATQAKVTAGATITAGKALYRDSADNNKYKLADAGAEATRACDGIALCGGDSGQPIHIARPSFGGTINLGATLTVGMTYCVADADANAGDIVPISDLASGDYPVIIGTAISSSVLQFGYSNPGTAKA